MDENLISKKEILEEMGISYGQLYRWKRKNLIPEEWFIRKSTFTGQETFFPRDKIIERIEKILNMKDDFSLDDIADVFSPQLTEILLKKQELLDKKIVSEVTLSVHESIFGEVEVFTFDKVLHIAVLEKLLQNGSIGIEEGKLLLQNLDDNYKNFKDRKCELIFIRKYGISTSMLAAVPNEIYFESGVKFIERVNITELIEELKLKILG